MNRATSLLLFVGSIFAPAAHGGDFATDVLNATFKLFNRDSTATCFLVQNETPDAAAALYLVTAAHVLEKTTGETAIIVLRKLIDDGSFERVDHTIPIRENTDPLWVRDPKQDVAVLPLPNPLPVEISPLPFSALAGRARLEAAAVHICSPLYVLTFPQRFETDKAGFPVARQGIFASPPLLPAESHPTFFVDFTTFSGDSGAPAFFADDNGQALLAGIVFAQTHYDEKIKTEYEERSLHHPLGLGNVLRAEYIRSTILAAQEKAASSTQAPGTDKNKAPSAPAKETAPAGEGG